MYNNNNCLLTSQVFIYMNLNNERIMLYLKFDIYV